MTNVKISHLNDYVLTETSHITKTITCVSHMMLNQALGFPHLASITRELRGVFRSTSAVLID